MRPQRTADQRHVAVVCGGGGGDALEPRHIAGEAGDRHAAVVAADELGEAAPYIGLGARLAGAKGVGRIADEGQHALVAQRPQGELVGDLADQRIGIELPIAGMQHHAGGRPDGERVGLGNRMGERDELEAEGAEGEGARQRHYRDHGPP